LESEERFPTSGNDSSRRRLVIDDWNLFDVWNVVIGAYLVIGICLLVIF
jgi:hypothetical protein